MSLIYITSAIYAPEHSFKRMGFNITINDESVIEKFPTLLPVSARMTWRDKGYTRKIFFM